MFCRVSLQLEFVWHFSQENTSVLGEPWAWGGRPQRQSAVSVTSHRGAMLSTRPVAVDAVLSWPRRVCQAGFIKMIV